MPPKTFQIRLSRPFGTFTEHAYLLHVHAQTHLEALEWAGQVFTGVDIEATKRRWAQPAPVVPRVGCNLPVSVIDCDQFRSRKRVGGAFVVQPTEPGHFRRSAHECTQDLLRVFTNLHEEAERLTSAFVSMKARYEQGHEPQWVYVRLQELKEAADRARVWRANVWAQYQARVEALPLVMPERRVPQAA